MARITLYGFYQYDKTLFDGVVLPDGINKENLISDIMRTSGDLYTYHQIPEMLKHNITYWFSRRLFDFERMYNALRSEYSPIENYDRMEDIEREYKDSGSDTETLTLGSSTEEVTTLGSSTKEVTTLGSSTEEVTTLGSSITTQRTGNDSTETQVSAYNETNYTNRDKEVQNYNSTFTDTGSGSDTRTSTGSGSDTRTSTGSGSDTRTSTGSGSDTSKTDYGKIHTETENTHIHGNIGVTTAQQMIKEEMQLRATYDIYRIITMEFEKEFLIQIY